MEDMSNGHPMTRRFLRAVYEGNKDEVIQLLDDGVAIDSTHQSGLQAIHFAAKSGDVEMSRELINKGASVNAVSQKGSTPLHIAALLGKTDVVKLLLKLGADVNRLSSYNDEVFTALYMASQIGHQEIVTLLLAYGADPTIQTKNGSTAKYVATQQGFQVVAQILEEYESKIKIKDSPEDAASNICTDKSESNNCDDHSKDEEKEEAMQISVEKLQLSDQNGHTPCLESNKENGYRKSAVGENNGAMAKISDRKFDSGKDIILNKLKATLPPMYNEAIPSPMHSPRRAVHQRRGNGKISPK